MDEGQKVAVVRIYQVEDLAKGSFYVGLAPTKERHHGRMVYRDAFGRRIVIEEAE